MSYTVYMRTTVLTLRVDPVLRTSLARRAKSQGKSLSGLVREILESAVAERPLGARAGHLRGVLRGPARDDSAWRKSLRENNWRP